MSKMKATYGDTQENYTRSLKIKSGIIFVWLIILTIICLLPIYILILNATRSHGEIISMTGLGKLFVPSGHLGENIKNLSVKTSDDFSLMIGYKNSLTITVCATFLTVFFSAMTAYGIRVYDFKLKDAAYTAILLVMMVPTQVSALGFVKMMGDWNLLNSYIPLIVPSVAAPVVFFFIKQYMDSVLPMELIEAARIDGAKEFRIFNQIVLPLMKPALAVQMIFTFVSSWNNYFIPSLLINKASKKTLPLLIAQLRSADFLKFDMGQVYMMIAFAIVPVIIVYICLSKFIVRGVTLGGVKG